jgi:hypothetical protein
MQCNVTWQTSSEYLGLTVPSGRTLNCISFVRKIQIPEIFGSPLVCVSYKQQERQGTHNVTLRRVRVTILAVEKQ